MTPGEQQKRDRKRRRAAVRHALFTRGPVRLMRGRLNRVRPGKDFLVNHREILFPDLADELCGLKIAHLSDPHVGELVTPEHLGLIVEAANGMGADMIVVTGDFVDFSNEYLPGVVEQMAQLDAPLGAWFVMGNHDYLDDGEEVKRAFLDAGLGMLVNESRSVEFGGKRIGLAGIDWDEDHRQQHRNVAKAAEGLGGCDLRILLAHHPHAFDSACRLGIDLTLSGHTHGGQMLLSAKRGKKGAIGVATMGFKYPRGLYEKGGNRLFVSSGVGSWFPVRFRCPAEMTLLELRSEF